MKIALFTDTLCDANGVSRFLQDMTHESHLKNFELNIFTSTRKKHCSPSPNIFNAKPRWQIPMPFYPELELVLPNKSKLVDACEAFSPDIIHVSTPGPVGVIGRSYALKHHLPLAGTYHTDFPQYMYDNTRSKLVRSATLEIMKRFYKPFDHLLTRSTLYRDILHDRLGFNISQVTTLTAGTNTQRFHPKFAQHFSWSYFGIPQTGLKVLYVGRLSKEKRFDMLLDIWKRLKKESSEEIYLVVIGEGKLVAEATSLRHSGVFYLGHREKEELSFLYAASDLFVSPSTSETLGQTILEAMASGTPVVVSGTGGQLDFVDQECGAIVRSDQPEIWVQTIKTLLLDNTQREEASKCALQKGQSMSIGRSFEHFVEIHAPLLKH